MKRIIGVVVVLALISVVAVYMKKSPAVPKAGTQAAKTAAAGQELPKKAAEPKNDCEFRTKFADIAANHGKTWEYATKDPLKTKIQGMVSTQAAELKKLVFKAYPCVSAAAGADQCAGFIKSPKNEEEKFFKNECSRLYVQAGFMSYAAGDARKRDFCSSHYKYVVAEDSNLISEEEFCSRAGKGLENLKELCSKYPGKGKDDCLAYFDEKTGKKYKSEWDLYRGFKSESGLAALPPDDQSLVRAFNTGDAASCADLETKAVEKYCEMINKMEQDYNFYSANPEKK